MAKAWNIDFIRKATRGLLEADGWRYVNGEYVQHHGADPVYQYVGGDFPGEASFRLDQWCKFFFCNGKNRGIGYFGVAIEHLRSEDGEHVEALLTQGDAARWLDALRKNSDIKLVKSWDPATEEGWDPYRPRPSDRTPKEGPLPVFGDPVAALRRDRARSLFLLRALPHDTADVEDRIKEAGLALFPVWRSIVLHQGG